ncbi:MAG: aromatic compound degradation protein PaaI [Pseudonocardiales bacterium]|nr:MAG: aromatic compound degradation protein PaaI [Pseudonocardiales bacterium]
MTAQPAASPAGWGEPRSRTVTWHDPRRVAAGMAGRTGLEFLQAFVDGELPGPPIAGLLGFRMASIAPGEVVFGCTPDESTYNPIGAVHGGLVCTLLDSVMGCAVHSLLPAGVGYTSIEISVRYLRPLQADGNEIIATGRVVKPGRRVSFAEGEVRDTGGKLVATGATSCLVFPLPG